eukprot:scaffold5141_cov169-Amphora_coffeaeformis.AAC.11
MPRNDAIVRGHPRAASDSTEDSYESRFFCLFFFCVVTLRLPRVVVYGTIPTLDTMIMACRCSMVLLP